MKTKTGVILGLMMFLQYYIWGSWYVTMGTFMTKFPDSTGIQIGAVYSVLDIATMISPFFIGMIADRFLQRRK
jgi:MFS family permease